MVAPLVDRYLSEEDWARASTLTTESVVECEARYPGYLDRRLQIRSAEISALLSKRYAVPLSTISPPGMVVKWLVDLVDYDAYMKIGLDPNAGADAEVIKAMDRALLQMQQAADAENGLYELPLREGDTVNGISKTGPLAYSELSPYTAQRNQRDGVNRYGGRRRFW